MKRVTIWKRWNQESKSYESNHTEDGWSKATHPKPLFESQNGWLKSKWQKHFGVKIGSYVLYKLSDILWVPRSLWRDLVRLT